MAEWSSRRLLVESDGQHQLEVSASWRPGGPLHVRRAWEEDERGPAYDSDMSYLVSTEAVAAVLASWPEACTTLEQLLDSVAGDPAAVSRLVDAAREHGESRSNGFWIH